jgi:hypothetical protein
MSPLGVIFIDLSNVERDPLGFYFVEFLMWTINYSERERWRREPTIEIQETSLHTYI